MKTATHGNGNGLNDLYILPDDHHEAKRIADHLHATHRSYHWSYSDVEGQDWHGRNFIEIPFGESLLPQIEAAARPLVKYRADFQGRDVGAIGVLYTISTTVEAKSEDEARLYLYDRYEHISQLKLTPA